MKFGVIAGTSSGRNITDFLDSYGIEYSIHIKKGYIPSEGNKITGEVSYFFSTGKKVGVCVGKKRYFYDYIIDLSHPFALQIKQKMNVLAPYKILRYLRKQTGYPNSFYGPSTMFFSLCGLGYTRILSLLGYKGTYNFITTLKNFDTPDRYFIISRSIQPVSFGVNYKFDPDLLFDRSWFDSILENHNIQAVLIKDSGKEGMTEEKIRYFSQKNKPVFMLKAPANNHATVFDSLETLKKDILQKVMKHEKP